MIVAGNEFNVTQNDTSTNVIIDTVNPTLSNLTIYSDNHNTSLATLGNTLNITITTNEDLSSANITILGATYTMSTSGMVANTSVTVTSSHADGKVEFNITALDLAGNSLAINQTNLNSPDLTIDKNVPSVTNLTLYSNNLNSSLARAGDLINITLEVSENIYNATLQILNTTINMTELNNVAYANISVLQNSTNGLVEFNITAYDDAGNEFNISQSIASANVIIDTVDPKSSNDTYEMSTNGMVANASVIVNSSHADGQVDFNITSCGFVLSIVRFEEFKFVGFTVMLFPCKIKGCNVEIDLAISVTAIYYHACVCHHTVGAHFIRVI